MLILDFLSVFLIAAQILALYLIASDLMMNNTPVVIVLIPVAIRLARSLIFCGNTPADPAIIHGGSWRNLHTYREYNQFAG
ncbi:hypothetical protein [Ruegeria atlantica]|uniref:hypothetical protein n=1 Tax=Ruegeria atlantica TaxID=81569 RepID=UPI002494DA77|nr:hypothetical protein [Ruegeria atlantica]